MHVLQENGSQVQKTRLTRFPICNLQRNANWSLTGDVQLTFVELHHFDLHLSGWLESSAQHPRSPRAVLSTGPPENAPQTQAWPSRIPSRNPNPTFISRTSKAPNEAYSWIWKCTLTRRQCLYADVLECINTTSIISTSGSEVSIKKKKKKE